MAKRQRTLLVTCEHGGNRIPPRYEPLFRRAGTALQSHRGFDAGALQLARQMARELRARLLYATTTRLLVDLNRSERHRQAFSAITRKLPAAERRNILDRFHAPYREAVEHWIGTRIARGERVHHVSCHSFTPVLEGVRRRADVGLLYDPSRTAERAWAKRWQSDLLDAMPQLVVRRNYPYLGTSDGLATHLRTRFDAASYAGIELEVNQRFVRRSGPHWRALRAALCRTLEQAMR